MALVRRRMLKGAMAVFAVMALRARSRRAHAGSARQPRHHLVEIGDLKFAPAALRVAAGDTITWLNTDVVPHTASAEDGSWDTGEIGNGERVQLTVTEGFAERYFCRYHPAMKARLTVKP